MNKREIKKLLIKAGNLIQDAEMDLENNEKIKDGSWIASDLNKIKCNLDYLVSNEF